MICDLCKIYINKWMGNEKIEIIFIISLSHAHKHIHTCIHTNCSGWGLWCFLNWQVRSSLFHSHFTLRPSLLPCCFPWFLWHQSFLFSFLPNFSFLSTPLVFVLFYSLSLLSSPSSTFSDSPWSFSFIFFNYHL